MRTEDDDQLHDWAPLYALDALAGRDRERFEEHLAGCAQCRDEVASFRETASALAEDEEAPPPAMRESVLARIDTVDQLPPDSATPPARPDRHARPDLHTGPGRHRGGGRRGRRLIGAAAGLALAAGLVGVVVVEGPWFAEEPAPPVAEQVLTAEDAQRFEEAPGGGEVSVVMSPSVDRAVVETQGLPPAPSGHSYQAWWLVGAGDPVSAGLLDPGESGETFTLLEGDPTAATGVALTVEPEGGSEAPTTEPIHVVEMGGP